MWALSSEDLLDLRRWALSALSVLAMAGGVALALQARPDLDDPVAAEPSGAIAVDFAAEAAAPKTDTSDLAPGPEQVAAEAVPVPVAAATPEPDLPIPDLPPVPDAEVVVPRKVEQAEAPAAPPQAPVATTSAPNVQADKTASIAASPTEGVPDPLKSKAVVTWRTQLLAVIEKNKRYPEAARLRREQGIATVAFTLDRAGRVVEARIVTGSGSATLDGEAISLLRRAQPFPLPPAQLDMDRIAISLPIRFAAR